MAFWERLKHSLTTVDDKNEDRHYFYTAEHTRSPELRDRIRAAADGKGDWGMERALESHGKTNRKNHASLMEAYWPTKGATPYRAIK